VDAATGSPTPWNPDANGNVLALTASGSAIYAGGNFTRIGGQNRAYITALDRATGGNVEAWSPGANYTVLALASSGDVLYVGGAFTAFEVPYRSGIAAVGDVVTRTLVSLVSTRVTPHRVELTWHAPSGDIPEAIVYRRGPSEDWTAVSRLWPDGAGRLEFRDTGVIAGTRYGYRLGVMEEGQEVYLGETWVDVPLAAELALALRSNPSPRELTAAFTLPDASPARLELFDLAGRMLASREVGSLGAGHHVLSLGSGERLPPGTYTLRLSHGDRSIHARGVILR
jgi:hypothetical protein